MAEIKTNRDYPLPGLLTIAFIVLRLCDVIDWSWWWVLSPTLIVIGIAAVASVIKEWWKK